jgi:hypothetical protein
VVRLSVLRTGPFYPPGDIPGTHFSQRLSRSHVHSAAGRIKSMKDPNDSIRNRTRDLTPFSAVPRPTVPPHAQFPLTHLVVADSIFCTQGTLYSNETLTPQQSVTSTNVTWRVFGWFALRTTVDRYWSVLFVCFSVSYVCCKNYFKPSILKWIRRCHCISARCRNFQYVWMVTQLSLECLLYARRRFEKDAGVITKF